jgi:hypothetical protein
MSGRASPRTWRQRSRLSIGLLMIVVAVLGLVVWGYVMKRRWDDYRRASDRMEWSGRMYQRGYVSKAQYQSEKAAFQRAKLQL